MKNIADLLFEAMFLKHLKRTGYQYLGAGHESVAEHSFLTAFIAFVMSQMEPETDGGRLVCMCLLHDLPETRTGDLNNVQKRYVDSREDQAIADQVRGLPFGPSIQSLIEEFNECKTREARLARDADQLSFILDLKALSDTGYAGPGKWLPYVLGRLTTQTGKTIAEKIMNTEWDSWWLKNYVDTDDRNR